MLSGPARGKGNHVLETGLVPVSRLADEGRAEVLGLLPDKAAAALLEEIPDPQAVGS